MDLTLPWSKICPVKVAALEDYCKTAQWPVVDPRKPPRIFQPPSGLTDPVVSSVMAHFPGRRASPPFLSLARPGLCHGLHVDGQNAGWVTRVHVVVTTNPHCWFEWEGEEHEVGFDTGWAYTFDTTKRHAFGNYGETDRVHLLWDVHEQP